MKAKQINKLGFIIFAINVVVLAICSYAFNDQGRLIPQEPRSTNVGTGETGIFANAKGAYTLRYASDIWSQSPTRLSPDSELELVHKNKCAWVVTIWEPIEAPPDKLEELSLKNFSSAGTSPVVVEEGWKSLSGKKIRFAIFSTVAEGIPVMYYAYFVSGSTGSIQALTYTGKNMFEQMRPELERLLNGLELPPDDQASK